MDQIIHRRTPLGDLQAFMADRADASGGVVLAPARAGLIFHVVSLSLTTAAAALTIRLATNPVTAPTYIEVPVYCAANTTQVLTPLYAVSIPGEAIGIRASGAGQIYAKVVGYYNAA